MFRSASRPLLRSTPRILQSPTTSSTSAAAAAAATRRYASTSTRPRRTLKGNIARLALATGAVYYAYTSDILSSSAKHQADVARIQAERLGSLVTPDDDDDDTFPRDIDLKRLVQETEGRTPSPPTPPPTPAEPEAESSAKHAVEGKELAVVSQGGEESLDGSVEELEQEADQQGAFNPETGEINWDCPCLGGMAHGPCGEEFRTAFSCFVYSTEEPKGVDCIEKFKAMQDCFRQHPEIYGDELSDEDKEEEREIDEKLAAIEAENESKIPEDATSAKGVEKDAEAESKSKGDEQEHPVPVEKKDE